MRRLFLALGLLFLLVTEAGADGLPALQFVYTADSYGIVRPCPS